MATYSGTQSTPAASRPSSRHTSINHSRPYTFESRRPHYYPNRASSPPPPPSSPPPPDSPPVGRAAPPTTRPSPPLHPDEIFKPPSLKAKSPPTPHYTRTHHMYNSQSHSSHTSAAPSFDPVYIPDAYLSYAYNPAVEPPIYSWSSSGGIVDLAEPSEADLIELRQRMILSRTRFALRLLATLCSLGVVAGIASALAVYLSTKSTHRILFQHANVWPEQLNLVPATITAGVGAATLLVGAGMLVASAFARLRHLARPSNIVNLLVSLGNVGLAAFALVYLSRFDEGPADNPTFGQWVCGKDAKSADPAVQFGMLCGEARFAGVMLWALVAVEGLLIANVFLGLVMLGWDGGRNVAILGRDAVDAVMAGKEAQKKKGEWTGGY